MFARKDHVEFLLANVDDLRAAVAILLALSALLTVVGVRDANGGADYALTIVGAVVAFVANPNLRSRPYIRVANHTSPIALLA